MNFRLPSFAGLRARCVSAPRATRSCRRAAAPRRLGSLLVASVCACLPASAAAQGFVPLPADATTRLVLIPAGSFRMGDTMGDAFDPVELPVHNVTLSAYYIQTTETTKAQWDEVRAWALSNGYTDLPAGAGKASNHPVHSVSWFEIVKWCNAASERAGLVPCYRVNGAVYRTGDVQPVADYRADGYRLPTEAEWEKAARGGLDGRRFGWGDTISHTQANYVSNATYLFDVGPTRGYHPSYAVGAVPYTSPVASFAANGYGLYDMSGNVWEVCSDGVRTYTSASVTDPVGPDTGKRAARSVAWTGFARGCRTAFRGTSDLNTRFNSSGFRPARSLIATAPVFSGALVRVRLGLGEASAARLVATGEPAPVFSVLSGSLPAGVSLSSETGALSGVPSRGGRFSGTFAATNSAGIAIQAFEFIVTTAFDQWAEEAGLTEAEAAPTAIPFQDAVPNLLKYAFNLDPTGPDTRVLTPGAGALAGLPGVAVLSAPDGVAFRLEYLRRRGAGMSYEPQESSDLQSFAPLAGETVVTDVDDFWERVSVRIAPSGSPRRFFRVEVSRP